MILEDLFRCEVDGHPCEVMALIMHSTLSTTICSIVQETDILPCNRCRKGERDIQRLRGVRLGHRERRILLTAPTPKEQPQVIGPEGDGRPVLEAHRRAIRKLRGAALLEVCRRPWGSQERRRPIRRTMLGQAVFDRIESPLRAVEPIRWVQHQAYLVDQLRLPLHQLLDSFGESIKEAEGLWQNIASIATITRSRKTQKEGRDPAQVLAALCELKGGIHIVLEGSDKGRILQKQGVA